MPKKDGIVTLEEPAQLVTRISIPQSTVPTKLAPAKPAKTTVSMKRHGEGYKPPHTAEVHVDEVDNWAKHGWVKAE